MKNQNYWWKMANGRMLLCLTVLALAGAARGEKYGGEFLNIPVGAKAMAMGGAFGPLADDLSAIYWNPAGLGRQDQPQAMLTHTMLFSNLASHDFLALSWPMGEKLTLGAAWLRLGIDDIPRFSYTVGTPPIGSLGDNQNAFYLSAASRFSRLILNKPWQINPGGSLKLIYHQLDDRQATGLGLDVGILLTADLGQWLARRTKASPIVGMLPAPVRNSALGVISLSLVGQDLGGTNLAWDTPLQHNDVRLAVYKVGLGYQQPIPPLRSTLSISWEGSNEDLQDGRLGSELRYRNLAALRLGRERSGTTLGGGISLWRVQLDYAYNGHDLGNTHRVGATYRLR